jgi:hypothetical protein
MVIPQFVLTHVMKSDCDAGRVSMQDFQEMLRQPCLEVRTQFLLKGVAGARLPRHLLDPRLRCKLLAAPSATKSAG